MRATHHERAPARGRQVPKASKVRLPAVSITLGTLVGTAIAELFVVWRLRDSDDLSAYLSVAAVLGALGGAATTFVLPGALLVIRRIPSFIGRIKTRTITVQDVACISICLVTILILLGISSVALGIAQSVSAEITVGAISLLLSSILALAVFSGRLLSQQSSYGSSLAFESQSPPLPKTDVEIVAKDVVYEYLQDGKHIKQRKRFLIRSMREGLASFPDRYHWTGTGACTLRSLTAGCHVSNQRKEEFWDFYDVLFPHPLRESEEIDFTIEWTLVDQAGTAVTFLSTYVDLKTEHLSLTVILPDSLRPAQAYAYDFANYIDRLPIKTEKLEWQPETKRLRYVINEPLRNHKYMIRWHYDEPPDST